MPELALPFWIAFLVSASLAYPCLLLMRSLNSVSETYEFAPEAHKKKSGTPNMGGLFVLFALGVVIVAFDKGLGMPQLILLLGFGLIGFVDDYLLKKLTGKRGISWRYKLVLQFAVGALYAACFDFTTQSFVAAFIIITFANAYNFADGLDGLAASILVAVLIPFLLAAAIGEPELLNPKMGPLVFGLAGATLPFLVLNAPPARVFLGDVGALPIGALFGMILVQSPYDSAAWPWVTVVLLVIELILVPVQVIAVKTIKRRVFPSTPIHHAFEVRGWPETRIVWTFFVFQLMLSAAAITLLMR